MKNPKLITVILPRCTVTKTAEGASARSNAGVEVAIKRFSGEILADYLGVPFAAAAKCLDVYTRLAHRGGVHLECRLNLAAELGGADALGLNKRATRRLVETVYRSFAQWHVSARKGEFPDVRPAGSRVSGENGDGVIWVDAKNPSRLMKAFANLVREIAAHESYFGAELVVDRSRYGLAIALSPTRRITEARESDTITCRGRVVSVNGDTHEVTVDCGSTTGAANAMIVQYGNLLSRVGMSVHETIADAVKYPGEKELLFTGYQITIKDVGGHRVQSRMVATGLGVISLRTGHTEAQARQIRGTEVDDADARGASKRKTQAVARTATPKGSRGHRRPKTPVQTSHDGHSAR